MQHLFEKKFWLSAVLLLGVLALVVAIARQLGSAMPRLRPLPAGTEVQPEFPSATQVEGWFAVSSVAPLLPKTNSLNPFFTLYFQPPPPPATRKVEVLYHGCWISSTNEWRAFVRLGPLAPGQTNETSLVLTNGAKVIADHAIRSISIRTLTLTNLTGQTNLLEFNVKKALDVPAS